MATEEMIDEASQAAANSLSSMSALLTDPLAVAAMRRHLFEVKEDITMSWADWQAIWPYVDNMWVERNASRAKDRQQFNCRIWRNDSEKKAGKNKRNRTRRDVQPCGMKMYVVKRADSVTVQRCPGRSGGVEGHNHDMAYLDRIKTPSAVMHLAAHVMDQQGKTPSEAVKDLKTIPIIQALERDGGLYIDSNRVRNAHKAQQQAINAPTNVVLHSRRGILNDVDAALDFNSLEGVEDRGLPVSCQCGAVRFQTPHRKPLALYHCHCLECQKQSASAFGTSAMYPATPTLPLPEDAAKEVQMYSRSAKKGKIMQCYFCKNCGTRLFHRKISADGVESDTISIKGGAIDGLDWHGGTHIWTKRAVVQIPRHARQWLESPPSEPNRTVMDIPAMPQLPPTMHSDFGENFGAGAGSGANGYQTQADDDQDNAVEERERDLALGDRLKGELDESVDPGLPAFSFGQH